MRILRRRARLAAVMLILAARIAAADSLRAVDVGRGVVLHYDERGRGAPVVFVHGSLSDGSYWSDELPAFAAAGFRAIAYSRRYNAPNTNEPEPGYSAVTDADDLAGLIRALHLGRTLVVGHSYGALTALFLAVRHPELVDRVVLCEAPAVTLLAHLSGGDAALGRRTLEDIEAHMVAPMKAAFAAGNREAGVRAFIDYVRRDPEAWAKMPAGAKAATLKDAHEWDVMMTIGDLFPPLDPAAAAKIGVPVLMLSGARSYPFLNLVDEELARRLPHVRRLVLPEASHAMWVDEPAACRKAVLDFFRGAR